MKKIIMSLLLIFCATFIFSACGKDEIIAVTDVVMYYSTIELGPEEETTIKYKVFPSNATNQDVQFISSNPASVSVDEEGKIKMLGTSSAQISVRTVDGAFVDYATTVPKQTATSISVSTLEERTFTQNGITGKLFYLSINQSKEISINFSPATATYRDVVFTSANEENVAIVSDSIGVIKGIKKTSSPIKITATTKSIASDGSVSDICAYCFVSVVDDVDTIRVSATGNGTTLLSATESENPVIDIDYDTYSSIGIMVNATLQKGDLISANNRISAYSSDESICSVDSITYASDNSIQIKITPKLDGSAKLFIVSQAINSNGKTLCRGVEINVYATVTTASASSTLTRKIANTSSGTIGSIFTINPQLFITAGDSNAKIFSSRSTYYFINSDNANCVSFAKQSEASKQISTCNQFEIKSNRAGKIVIYIAIAKTNSSEVVTGFAISDGSVTGLTGATFGNYVCIKYEFYARPSLDYLLVKCGDDYVNNNDILTISGNKTITIQSSGIGQALLGGDVSVTSSNTNAISLGSLSTSEDESVSVEGTKGTTGSSVINIIVTNGEEILVMNFTLVINPLSVVMYNYNGTNEVSKDSDGKYIVAIGTQYILYLKDVENGQCMEITSLSVSTAPTNGSINTSNKTYTAGTGDTSFTIVADEISVTISVTFAS